MWKAPFKGESTGGKCRSGRPAKKGFKFVSPYEGGSTMIYIGHFLHTTNQEEKDERNRRRGEFSMIVGADDPKLAVEHFKQRLIEYRQSSDFFQGDCAIFFTQLVEFENPPQKRPVMLNYKSYAGDPILPFIGCTAPSEAEDGCRIYDWRDNEPEIDGQKERIFLEFRC